MIKVLAASLLALLLVGTSGWAEDLNFQSTAEGIEFSLLKTADKLTVRDKRLRGGTSGKIRGVQYVGKEPSRVHETVKVPYGVGAQGVNLNIKFDVDSYQIRPDSYQLLAELGTALTGERLKDRKIAIIGHTDSDGGIQHNYRLSLDRAQAVKDYLVAAFSISPDRLVVIGYGESHPLVHNMSAVNKQINRRVEIGLLN